jgi:hypothetical protein
MYIYFGKRLYGRVDVVPRVLHVATEFFHVSLVPLVPLKTWIVVKQKGVILPRFDGVPIPLDWKSVVMGWMRGWSGMLAVFAAAGILVAWPEDRPTALGLAGFAAFFAFVAWITPVLSRASHQRAKHLARRVGGDLLARVDTAFDRASPKG